MANNPLITLSEIRRAIKNLTGEVVRIGRLASRPISRFTKNIILSGDAVSWDDIRFPVFGRRMDTAFGRIDFDYTNVGLNFQYNSRYHANDQMTIICQFSHSKLLDSTVKLHVHWAQVKDQTPNMLIEYRWYNNNDTIPAAWTQVVADSMVYTYVAGTLAQISEWAALSPPANENLSSILEIKFFRDTNNGSGVFAGNCPYNIGGNTSLLIKELDIHYQIDGFGSNLEYTK